MHSLSTIIGFISFGFAVFIVIYPEYAEVVGIALMVATITLIMMESRGSKKILINEGKTSLIMEYGDIMGVKDGIVVIPFDRNYNTSVDDVIISHKSLHGQFIDTIGQDEVCCLIASRLRSVPNFERSFDLQPLGCVLDIPVGECNYYLLALSKLDQYYKAQCTYEEYVYALNRLMDYADVNLNGRKLYIPLIGGGLSDVFRSLSSTESLQMMVSLLKMSQRTSRIKEIHVVINKESEDYAHIQNVY